MEPIWRKYEEKSLETNSSCRIWWWWEDLNKGNLLVWRTLPAWISKQSANRKPVFSYHSHGSCIESSNQSQDKSIKTTETESENYTSGTWFCEGCYHPSKQDWTEALIFLDAQSKLSTNSSWILAFWKKCSFSLEERNFINVFKNKFIVSNLYFQSVSMHENFNIDEGGGAKLESFHIVHLNF